MGQLLSQPITEKNITLVQHDHISHSIGEMQGYRLTMEDAYCDLNDTIIIKTKEDTLFVEEDENQADNTVDDSIDTSTAGSYSVPVRDSTTKENNDEKERNSIQTENDNDNENENGNGNGNDNTETLKLNIYGVFDGHGGSSSSKYISEHLPIVLRSRLVEQINQLSIENKIKLAKAQKVLELINFPLLLKSTFMECDSMFYNRQGNNNSGSTAVVVLIFQSYVFAANSGDSRCILSSDGNTKLLSFDHKPKNLGELMRIHNDGGYVSANRVNSILALSRAFGDFTFKMHNNQNHSKLMLSKTNPRIRLTPPEEYQVTAEPDIIIHKIFNSSDEFLVIACDGIWDCYKSCDLIVFIRNQLALGKKLPEINELVLDNCIGMANTITGIGFDNMTLMIVALHESFKDLNTWYSYMKNKVLDEKFGKVGGGL